MGEIIWTEYMEYRAHLRRLERGTIEEIVLFSEERYFDSATQRMVAVGRHGNLLLLVPYEQDGETFTPITAHATARQQINVRLKTGRFKS
jgi:hypothetical protein